MFGTRLSEHQAETRKVENKKYTRSERKASEKEQSKSAISDHAARANHVINWDESKIIGREHDRRSREVREAMEIRKRGEKVINREEGTYLLSHVYDPLLTPSAKQELKGRKVIKFPAKSGSSTVLKKSSVLMDVI